MPGGFGHTVLHRWIRILTLSHYAVVGPGLHAEMTVENK